MALRTTELGLKLIKAFEGCKLRAYRCPAGIWTIGYGHTTAAGAPRVTSGITITLAQAEAILRDDVDHFEDQVEKLLAGHMPNMPSQFDALVSLAYNIGIGAFAKSTLLAKIKLGKLDDVPAQFMRWNKVNGVAFDGLTRRRRAEAAMWRGDLEEAGKYAHMDFGLMPQVIDVPQPPKKMTQSKIGNAQIVGGGTTAVITIKAVTDTVSAVTEQVKAASEVAKGTIDTSTQVAAQVANGVNTLGTIGPYVWGVLGVVAVCACVYAWLERRRILNEEHV